MYRLDSKTLTDATLSRLVADRQGVMQAVNDLLPSLVDQLMAAQGEEMYRLQGAMQALSDIRELAQQSRETLAKREAAGKRRQRP